MKIKAALIEPSSNITKIQGDNDAGKTTALNCIIMALKGGSLPDQVITKGQKKGSITVEIGGVEADGTEILPPFTVTKSITDSKSVLSIKPSKVLKGETPRSFLDGIIGNIFFDFVKFINDTGPNQKKTFMDLIGIDTVEIDANEKDLFDERAEASRNLKTAKAVLEDMVTDPAIEETKELSVQKLSNELADSIKSNQVIETRITANAELRIDAINVKENDIPDCETTIAKLKAGLKREEDTLTVLESDLDEKRVAHKKEKSEIEQLEMISITDIKTRLSTIEETNRKIRDNIAYVSQGESIKRLQSEYDTKDTKLTKLRQSRVDMIKDAYCPIKELTMDDTQLLYNGFPLKQCSGSEDIEVAMGLSMLKNPVVKVVCIKDGSLLGEKKMDNIKKMAKAGGFDVWIELVQSQEQYDGQGAGFFIEEGEIIKVDGKKPKAKPKAKKNAPKKEAAKKENQPNSSPESSDEQDGNW